ncbi:SusC/RagA family TonB-linked outer membrane protein [Flavobacterium sp. N3904]|uniref:SusC/RagA family TonB-linked outer membrane protein n=1 Tax=Flavobacterium sp. N3904 TaxID=2986835 RepID=UPI002224C84A|nr:SusC/RagA family TonB-linked outer membrane protein [Flavobacterium sp. N3904]
MKNSLQKGLMVFITMLCTSLIYSQDVSGLVTDASGPLPGVSILVKGTKTETQTDFDGKFIIKNVGSNAVLVFTYIGLKTQEVSVGGKSTLNVTMAQDQSQLNEVVVIGYGTAKKKDLTGAVDVLGSKDFDGVSNTSPALLLRGKVAGVQITQTSGEPGSAVTIRVRGSSSVRSGNGPLVVVDGVPLAGGDISSQGSDLLGTSAARNPLNFINEADIASISVLKDAASTAIYGSRGANGVIVITTKKGNSNIPEFNFSTSTQISTKAGNYGVMNPDQFVTASKAAGIPKGQDFGGRDYNWEDAVLQTGIAVNNNLSFNSANENSSTRVSLSASNNEGIVKNTGLEKYTASFYNSNNFFDKVLKVDTKLLYASVNDYTTLVTNNAGYIGNVIGTALYWNPTLPIYKADGSYNVVSDTYLNPVQLLDSYQDYTNTNKLLGSINASLNLGSHFKYNFLFGVENSTSSRKSQILPTMKIQGDAFFGTVPGSKPVVTKYGTAAISNISAFNKTVENNLNYTNQFSDNFNLNALVGYSYYSYLNSGNVSSGKGYDPAQTNLIDDIEGGLQNEFRVSSYKNFTEVQSLYARADVTFYKKYVLTASVRTDGSSKFGSNYKYGTFPAVGIADNIFENHEGILNNLKLRANWGITGNQEFAANSAIGRASYGNNGALNVDANANENLKWETTESWGVGTDFTLLENRLTGSLDYFHRDTKDLIFPVPQASTQPGPNSPRNKNLPGNLINTGIEISLDYTIIQSDDITWSIAGNASFLKNEIQNFNGFVGTGGLNGQGLTSAYTQVITNDQPLYTYFLYDFQGYDADGNSIYTNDAGEKVGLGEATKQLLDKQPLPKINYGFSSAFKYKNFDATVSFYGAAGHYIYDNTQNAYFFKGAFLGGRNVTEEAAYSAQGQGDPNSPSTKYLQSGDFLRMGELTFGYTFTGGLIDRMKCKNLRFYVNGSNLLLFTNYTGFDPEVDINKQVNGVPSAGMDYLAYPRSKGIAFGLNVTF